MAKHIKWNDVLYIAMFNTVMKLSLSSILKLESNLPYLRFSLLVLSTIFILIGGNLAIVFFNKNEKLISKKILLVSYLSLFFIANILGFYIKVTTNYNSYFITTLFFTLFVFFYSEFSFKKTFLNNIIEAFLITFAIILVWWFDPIYDTENHWKSIESFDLVVVVFVSLTFIANLVKNTLVDFSTLEADKRKGFKTLPIALGEKKAKKVLLFTSVLIIIVLTIVSVFFVKSIAFSIILLSVTLLPTYFIYLKLIKINHKKGYLQLIKLYYIVIFLGMISIPIISLVLKEVL